MEAAAGRLVHHGVIAPVVAAAAGTLRGPGTARLAPAAVEAARRLRHRSRGAKAGIVRHLGLCV